MMWQSLVAVVLALEVRDGPLEKLWVGGDGNFRAAGTFFRYQIPCMNFFRPLYEYFLGLVGVQEFFSFNFPLREFFFCTSPAPHKFCNGPSLNIPLVDYD